MRARGALLLLCLGAFPSARAQTAARITGTVTSGAGQPVAGATVVIEQTRLGAVTGADGRYTIPNVEPGARAVRASMIGYRAQTRTVSATAGQAAVADFQLEAVGVQLNEVVVVGYGTVRRSDLTGSTSPIRTQDIQSLPVTAAQQAIQGRVAGVQVTQNSGKPGAGYTVRVRGGNSMLGGNDPLYVVDGFPISIGGERGQDLLGTMNPDDIASIEVLKDASATAIYGARGANGVVMITTKRGSATGKVELETYYASQQVSKAIPLMNARQYAELANEFARNAGSRTVPFPDPTNLPHDTDWQDEIFRAAPQASYALSLSGGGGSTRYLASGNYLRQDGVVRSSGLDRGTARVNLDGSLNARLSLSNQLLLARTSSRDVPSGEIGNTIHNAFVAPPTVPVYDANGGYYDYSSYWWWGSYPRNPVMDVDEVTNRLTNTRLLESVSGEYALLGGLKAKALFGADYLATQSDYYATRLHLDGAPSGVAQAGRGETLVYLNENTLAYARELGASQRLDAVGGFTWQRSQSAGLSARTSGFVNDLLGNNALGTGADVSPPNSSRSDWSLRSWLGRANYSLLDRYLVTVSGRYDGSSRFGGGNKWAFFPSAAFAWRVSGEPFLANVGALSNLKLRVSWGRTGNQEIGLYNSLQRVAPELLVIGNGLTTGFAPANIANPDLRWETTSQVDGGVDVGLWNDRLTLTADAYVKNTSDLLARVSLPSSSGFTSMLRNVGAIRNSGLELGLDMVALQTPRLRWSVAANAAANRNEVRRLADGKEFMAGAVSFNLGSVNLVREGEPLSAFYVFRENGLDDKGSIRYVDGNGDGQITDLDRVIVGSPYPKLTYGLSSSLTVGRFDVAAALQGVSGNKIFNTNLGFAAASFNRGENQIVDVYHDHWSPERPNPNAKYPKISSTTVFRPSERFIEDGSYFRLKSARVGYRVPMPARAGARDLTVYVSGQNLFTRTDYSWYDPEISQYAGNDLRQGIDYFTYPQTRTVSFGLRVGM